MDASPRDAAPGRRSATPAPAAVVAPEAPAPDARRATALVVGVAATVAFAALRLVVALGGHDPLAVDLWWDELMSSIASPGAVLVAWVPAVVGGTVGMIAIGLLLIAVFALRRRFGDAANMAASIVLVVAIGAPMAAVIARHRPAGSLAETMATSFPSGHTAVATTVVLTLALILRRRWVWGVGVAWVLLMMWSRTFLHAHWLSDVVAGALEGIVVATFVWCVAEVIRERRARRSAFREETRP